MQTTSELYKRLLSEEHTTETWLAIGNADPDTDYPGAGFMESEIFSLSTTHALFETDVPAVGCATAGQIDVTLLPGNHVIPRMAKLVPYIRLISADGTEHSEWLPKGEYFIDTREITHNDDGLDILTIHGYDALLKAQADYPNDSSASYPAKDTVIVQKIAAAMGVELDSRTLPLMNGNYRYGLPLGYSMQEVLSSIAVPYAGNWIMTEEGKLRLVSFADIPKETRLLTDEYGYAIIFGTEDGSPIVEDSPNNVRILV